MNANDIRDRIAELTLELNEYRKDVAVLDRLRHAETEVRRLTPILDKLTADLNDVLAAEAKAKEQQFKDSIRNVKVA